MSICKGSLTAGVCILVASILAGPVVARAASCTSSQSAAVECFVANAVTTKITSPRHGMTLAQYEAYGVAVTDILQTNHTYLTLTGIASAIADAMPPTNANGSANQSAQTSAVMQIVAAAVTNGLATAPTGVTEQQMQWFSLDMATAMSDNDGYMSLMTPGVALRILDSYIVTATSGGTVNWTQADASIANAVSSFISSGLIKIPSGMTSAEVTAFLEATAKAIFTYKTATARTSL